MTHDPVERLRQRIFGGKDNILYQHVGYFLAWYSSVEFRLTFLLAIVSGLRDMEVVDLLTKGMDARVKVNRVRSICQKKKRPIDKKSNFGLALTDFHDKLIPVRNKLSHNALAIAESGEPRLFITGLNRMPYKAFGDPEQLGESPEEITFLKLFEYGLWLNHFNDDMGDTITRAMRGESLDIGSPRSWALSEHPQNHAQKDAPSNPDTSDKLIFR